MNKYFKSVLIGLAIIISTSGLATAATVLFPSGGGTGTSTAPSLGQLLVGNSNGTYNLVSTSSLGILNYPSVGSSGFVQFASSTANFFNATSSFFFDITNKFLGVNKTTPLATVHAGANTITTATPTGFSSSANFGVPGYAFGSGNKNYSIYQRVGGIFSTAVTGTHTELTAASSNFGSYGPVPNYSGSGYTPTGIQIDFEIFAYFPDGTISPAGVTNNFTDDGLNPYSVTHTWSSNLGNPQGILLIRNATDYLIVPNQSSSPYEDTNIGWSALPHGLSTVSSYSVTVNAGVSSSPSPSRTVFRNTTTSKFTNDDTASPSATDSGTWTTGSPSLTPTSGPGFSAIFDGTVRIGGTNSSSFGIFEKSNRPVPYQSNVDIITGLSNYGFFDSTATLAASKLSGSIAVINGGTGVTNFGSTGRVLVAGSAGTSIVTNANIVILDSNRIGVGASNPVAIGHFIGTGYPQARWGNDTSNYLNLLVNSSGLSTFDAVGATSSIVFSDNVSVGSTTAPSTFSVKGSAANNLFNLSSSTGATLFNVNQGGHIVTGGGTTTVSSCGTTPSISGNDTAGTVTVGSGVVTACTITFARTRTNTPKVVGVVTGGGLNIAGSYSAKSTTAVTFSFAATIGSGTFDYLIVE